MSRREKKDAVTMAVVLAICMTIPIVEGIHTPETTDTWRCVKYEDEDRYELRSLNGDAVIEVDKCLANWKYTRTFGRHRPGRWWGPR